MLREVSVDTKPDGRAINVPVEVSDSKMHQYVKRFIETTDYNFQDGSGLVSLFRSFHGGLRTLRVLEAVLDELRHPSIQLDLQGSRDELLPFFEEILVRHQNVEDADFGYPHDRSRLPM
jgi:hypothetical protein